MTAEKKYSIANWVYKLVTASGVLAICIYGFVAEGRREETIDRNQQSITLLFRKVDDLQASKANKEDITKIIDDVQYIRKRLDDYILKGK